MPWRTMSLRSLRYEFVSLAQRAEVHFSVLCQRFGISRKTGYKWLRRYRAEGKPGLVNRSRRPYRVPRHVTAAVEAVVVQERRQHPTWGARKLRRRSQAQGQRPVPACSTITAILHRQGLIVPEGPGGQRPWHRFEHPVPNSLWQMDFRGPVAPLAGPAHPLTILDDHSRFTLCVQILPTQQTPGVQQTLTATFRRYGLPDTLLVDNGSPWGSDAEHPYTPLTVWLIRLGLRVSHSRPYHPQTLGKDERFHGTLKRDLLARQQWRDLAQLQAACDRWCQEYNFERPHEALALVVSAARYHPSLRPFPETLPPIEYPGGMAVHKVQRGGAFFFHGGTFQVSKAFCGYPVGLRPTLSEGVFDVLFCHQAIAQINLRTLP